MVLVSTKVEYLAARLFPTILCLFFISLLRLQRKTMFTSQAHIATSDDLLISRLMEQKRIFVRILYPNFTIVGMMQYDPN